MTVQVNNAFSTPREVLCSVLQGSVAGPVLFTAYASTILDAIDDPSINLSGYADDHGLQRSFKPSIYVEEDDSILSLQSSLSSIKDWMDANKLKMNSSKTEFMYIGSWQQLCKCNYASSDMVGTKVLRSAHVKYLGVVIDENLTLQKHNAAKCRVAALNIQYISSIRKHLTLESAKQLCYSLVLSHIDYCNVLFMGLPDSTLAKLQRIQNWAAKVALQRRKHDSSHSALYELHWLPVKYRVQFKILLFVFKALRGLTPAYISNLIVEAKPKRATRSSSNKGILLEVPSTKRMTFAARSFSVVGPTLWNSLPSYIKLSDTIENFRKAVKTLLFEEAFRDLLC
jgi:hypothetical protein